MSNYHNVVFSVRGDKTKYRLVSVGDGYICQRYPYNRGSSVTHSDAWCDIMFATDQWVRVDMFKYYYKNVCGSVKK